MGSSEMRDNFQGLVDLSETNPTIKAILNADLTTSTRCNWCGHPLIFHSLRRTRWHGFLCRARRLSKTFEYVPLVRRNRP